MVELKQPKEKKDVGGIGRQMSMRISPRKTTLLNNSPYVQDSEPEPPMPVPLYKVHAQKAGFGSKDNVSQPPGQGVDTNKRITQLQAYISIEEKYAQGAQSIINASTTEAQRVMAAQQLENFKANIREWNVELVKLVAQNHMMQPQIDDDLKRVCLN